MAGGGANNNAWWDPTNSALIASGSGNGFIAHEVGYFGAASDCYQDVMNSKTLAQQFDSVASNGNVVECGKIGVLGADTTFTVALGYGSDAASAEAAANASLASGFTDREAAYSGGWEGYVKSLRPAPASVASNPEMTDRIDKRLEDVKQSVMNRHRTIHILRAVWHHWIRAGRTKICEKGLQENRKGTTPRRQARTT